MRPYVGLARLSWSSLYVYRGTFLLLMLGSVVQCLALLTVWRAVLGDDQLGGFGWEQMRAYVLVAFVTTVLVSGFSDLHLASRVLTGTVSLDLVKPVDFQVARFAESVGCLGAELAMAATTVATFVLAFGSVAAPSLLSLASLGLVVPLTFGIVYLTGLLCFWTGNHQGVVLARAAVAAVLSGAMVPIPLFPQWLQWLCYASPFPATVSTPALVHVGAVDGNGAGLLVAHQAFWVVVLWVVARRLFPAATRRLTVHGG